MCHCDVCSERGGGGACSHQERNETPPPPTRVCSERGWCLLVVPILIAPHFHPTSSCLWQQLGVLSWWWSSGPPCHPLSSSSSSSLLKVVGGASSARHCGYTRAGVLTWCPAPSPLPSSSHPALVVIIIVSLSSSFHPLSTPQAVACEAGGRWCSVSCSPLLPRTRKCCLEPLLLLL